MTERPEVRKKRAVEEDLRDEEIDNTPRYADAKTMAERRVVRVRRPTSNTDAAASLNGVFKAVSGVLPTGAPTLSTKFSLGDTNKGSGNTGGAFAPATTSLPFGGKPAADGFTTSKKFSFDLNNDNKGNNESGNNSSNGIGAGNEGGSTKASFFCEAFKSSGAVNLFAEAKERMAKTSADTQEEVVPSETIGTTDLLVNADPVVPSTGDVLASVSCKLFVFKPETKNWVECGVGGAKIKRHEFPIAEGEEKKTKYVYRLIVRDGYALNALLGSNFCLSKAEDTHIIFAMLKENNIVTYFLRYTGQQPTERGAEFTRVLKEALNLAHQNSF